MQYALWKWNDRTFVIEASEYQALITHPTEVKDIEEDQPSMPLKLVYGSYKPQHNLQSDSEAALTSMKESKGYRLGHVVGKECREIFLCDIEPLDTVQRERVLHIPFAALVRTHLPIPDGRSQAVTGFLRYLDQMTPAENLLKRPGLFAFKTQERRPAAVAGLTEDGWRTRIDRKRVLRAAEQAV